jgi:hypothetical protein
MEKLFKLTNDELENSMGFHVLNERRTLHIILEHINEVYRRDLHLERGFGSMKEYLVKKWGYSERDAYRRMDGANLLKDVPALVSEIKNGTINADKIGELARAVKEKEHSTGKKVSVFQKNELVALISGKTGAESQRDLAKALDIQVKKHEVKRVQQDDSVWLGFPVSKKLYDNFNRCKEHASHKIQQDGKSHSIESVFEIFTKLYMLENNLSEETDSPEVLNVELKDLKVESTKVNKTLTPKTRQAILKRDKCCQYKDPKTGRKCESKFFEQIDHKTSQWAGGNHAPDNLQVLCANHNRFKYRKESQLRWL